MMLLADLEDEDCLLREEGREKVSLVDDLLSVFADRKKELLVAVAVLVEK